jgi:hypothetical protein
MAINRSMDDVAAYANALFHPDGSQKKKNLPRSDDRLGTTGHPSDTGDLGAQKNIPIVHATMNAVKHMQNIGHHLNAEVEAQGMSSGRKKSEEDKARIEQKKEQMHDEAKYGPLNIRIGEADGVNGGNTDTCQSGNQSKLSVFRLYAAVGSHINPYFCGLSCLLSST